MIKLEHMRQFLAVCHHNSLTDAANALHRTPSAVSMTLKQMEKELGLALFEGDRKQQLTPVGEYLRTCSERAVTEFEKALEDIDRFACGISGRVKVAAVPSVATHLLPLAVTELHSLQPDIRIELRDIDSSAVARAVTEGASDFGIASLSPHSVDLKAELMTAEPYMCICPEDHPLVSKRTAVSWKDLDGYPMIANGLMEQIEKPEVQALVTGANIKIRNTASLIAFVSKGIGITLLPKMAISMAPNLCAKPLSDRTVKRQLYFLQEQNRSLSPAANALKSIVIRRVQELIL